MTRRLFGVFTAAFALASCASAPLIGTDGIGRHVARNASILNDAHAAATNEIILKNILRARDRWPTNYTTLTGIQTQPRLVNKATATFDPLGLGNPPLPFGKSKADASQESTGSLTYSVNPFANAGAVPGVLVPIPTVVFQSYWNAGWPPEMLLYLLVNAASTREIKEGGLGKRKNIVANFIEDDGQVNKDFESVVNTILESRAEGVLIRAEARDVKPDDQACKRLEIKKMGPYVSTDEKPPATGILGELAKLKDLSGGALHVEIDAENGYGVRACAKPTSEVALVAYKKDGAREPLPYTFELRNFDSAIYYVGASLRRPASAFTPMMPRECKLKKEQENGKDGALFSVREEREAGAGNYAVKVRHAGKTYYAGPQLLVNDLYNDEFCRSGRTQAVMGVLSQLFLFMQSNEFLKAPENTFTLR